MIKLIGELHKEKLERNRRITDYLERSMNLIYTAKYHEQARRAA